MEKPHEEHIEGVVCHYSWGGINQGIAAGARGEYSKFQPASNGGTVRIANKQGITDLWFGGPGKNEYIEVTVDTFYSSAKKLMESFCYGTEIRIVIERLPGNSFPNIVRVA